MGLAVALVGLLSAGNSAFAQGQWTLTKTPNPTTYTAAGQVIAYTYLITNNQSFDGIVQTFTDTHVATIDCPNPPIVPGSGSLTCTGSYTIQAVDVTAGFVTNTATLVGDTCRDSCINTFTAQATVTLDAQPSWTLTKSPNPTTYGGPGEEISYSYLLTNTGNVGISAISIGDNKVALVTCPAATLAAGASMTCNGTYTTTEADVTAGSVINTATATGTPDAGTLPDVTAQATITFVSSPAWTLTKAADPTTYSGSEQPIAYTYVLTNTGNVDINFIALNDDKAGAASCPSPSLAVGDSMTCTANYTTTPADVTAGSVTNIATASGTPTSGTLADVSAQATITLVGTPAWTLTKTANPTTFTAVGQTIDYSYLLTNTGNVTISAISLVDDKVSSVECPSDTLAAGDSMTCTGSYVTTAGDADAGSVTNIATATGTPAFGVLAPVTAQATVQFVPPAAGSITIVKTATRGNGTFSFTSSVPGAGAFGLTTQSGSATRTFSGLSAATYTFTEVDLPAHWKLSALTCAGDTGGTPTVVDLTNRTVAVGLDGGEAITCTFANAFNGTDETRKTIAAFLVHRLTLLDDGPDRIRIFRRIPDALWGNAATHNGVTSTGPFAFSGNSSDGGTQITASTSLSQLSQTYAQAAGTVLPTPTVDVWLETHYSEFEDDASNRDSDGRFSVTYLGADYLVTPAVLIGALAQFDWTEEQVNNGGSVSGFEVMAGPYISARLTSNLFFTGRAAYGISDNSVDPFGLYTDDFSTDRWLASAELTGNWQFGNWRVTPTARVTYAAEEQHSYTDSLGELIPSQVVSVGRVAVGPELAYRYLAESGTVIEPMVSLTGIWDFDSSDGADLTDLVTTDDEIRAMAKAGFLTQMTGGATFRVVGTYDGIGSDGYSAFGGQAWLSIPLR